MRLICLSFGYWWPNGLSQKNGFSQRLTHLESPSWIDMEVCTRHDRLSEFGHVLSNEPLQAEGAA